MRPDDLWLVVSVFARGVRVLFLAPSCKCLGAYDILIHIIRVISTFKAAQNKTGGFGGGHGQMSHLASTFPAILSLALVGGDDAYEVVDRKAM